MRPEKPAYTSHYTRSRRTVKRPVNRILIEPEQKTTLFGDCPLRGAAVVAMAPGALMAPTHLARHASPSADTLMTANGVIN